MMLTVSHVQMKRESIWASLCVPAVFWLRMDLCSASRSWECTMESTVGR